MKMLYILNVANRVNNFCMSSLIAAKNMNIEYHIAGNWGYANDLERVADEEKYGIHIHQIDFIRSPLDIRNYKAYKQLKEVVSREKYDVIHCNTPIGGVLGRLVGKKCKVKNIIYQAHGFHFFKGAPLLNWLVYFPMEWFFSFFTDVLITINKEDFDFSKKMKSRKIKYTHGIGVDVSRFGDNKCDKNIKRKEIGLPENAIMLLSVGEINKNKNHEVVLRALAKLDDKNVYYCIAGKGTKDKYLLELAENLHILDRVIFLGFREDINELLVCSDIFCFPSLREGLPVSLMEAMAAGLPVVCSEIRGNTDLIVDGQGGFLCKPNDINGFAEKINKLSRDIELRERMKNINLDVVKNFSSENVNKEMQLIYEEILNEKM